MTTKKHFNQVFLKTISLVIIGSISTTVNAKFLNAAPNVTSYDNQSSALSGDKIGNVDLCTDGTKVFSVSQKKGTSASYGRPIPNDAIIQTSATSRCQLIINKARITVGNDSLIGIKQSGGSHSISFWQGSVIVDNKTNNNWVMNMHQGKASFARGKYASKSRHEGEADVIAYTKQASWTTNSGESKNIATNNILRSRNGEVSFNPLSAKIIAIINDRLNPKQPFLASALDDFKTNKGKTAKRKFRQLQTVYPNNPEAAYYLGTIALNEKNNTEVIKQWEKYIEIDPTGAEKRDVLKNLTVIKDAENQAQVKEMLANESQFSDEPPEPGTIAIMPFKNKGDKNYNMMSKGITAMVITDLSKVPGLKVLEREKVQKFIDEISLSQSGLVDQDTSIKAGRIMRAEKIIDGDFSVK
jgi:TolA-binding protein